MSHSQPQAWKSRVEDQSPHRSQNFDTTAGEQSISMSEPNHQIPHSSSEGREDSRRKIHDEERVRSTADEISSADELEKRLKHLNDKVDKVTTKTYRMLNRSSNLNNSSMMLKEQVTTLQYDLKMINQNLR